MTSSLEKRIKKHVIGKPHLFEAVAPLGFEQTLADELEFIGVECSSSELSDGKVRFTAKITEAWKAVAHSRIANRVLMEIANFKAENFGQLEKKASEIPWELYVRRENGSEILQTRDERRENANERFEVSEHSLSINVTCKHSRLYHSDAVAERLRNVICRPEATRGAQSECNERPHTQKRSDLTTRLFVRLENDRCSIWLDLAGEELYKRGHERFVAEAPLKETIAAAMIFEALKFEAPGSRHENCQQFTSTTASRPSLKMTRQTCATIPQSECNERPHTPKRSAPITFIDPMAGSGTFSLEAAYIACGLIPGVCRDFALKHQPAFKDATWNYLLKTRDERRETRDDRYKTFRIITSDISERPINIIKHNVENSPLPAGIINPQLKDFFSYTLEDLFGPSSIILLNPPYGKRLALNAPKLYEKIGQKIAQWSRDLHIRNSATTNNQASAAITIAILVPKDCMQSLTKACPQLNPVQNPLAKLIETSHGGFSLNAIFAKI